ncbi:MAG: hypothetical protein V8R46_07920 [Eubacterium ramulus]
MADYLLPKFLFMVLDTMYKIPSYTYLFHAGYGISGIYCLLQVDYLQLSVPATAD